MREPGLPLKTTVTGQGSLKDQFKTEAAVVSSVYHQLSGSLWEYSQEGHEEVGPQICLVEPSASPTPF